MEQLRKAFEQLNISVNEETVSKFKKYMGLVLAWNEKINLTAITGETDFIKKHFIDSLLCANFDEVKNADTLIDVGTGAGFPGVPLALVFPHKQFLLIDSIGKKVKILGEIAEALELSNVNLLQSRAEDLARKEEFRENFDVCLARAVAGLATLSEYCLPFVKIGGSFISYKGPGADEEAKGAEKAIETLGGKFVGIRRPQLEGFDFDHSLIVIKKTQKTHGKYPRSAGIPTKAPL